MRSALSWVSDASECAFRHTTYICSRKKVKHQDKPGMVGHFQTNQLGYTFNSASFQIIQNIIYKGEGGGEAVKLLHKAKALLLSFSG